MFQVFLLGIPSNLLNSSFNFEEILALHEDSSWLEVTQRLEFLQMIELPQRLEVL